MISELEKRVQRYWTQRSHDFGTVRRNELEDEMGRKWFQELEKHLPENGKLKVLDVGTGTGFFAVLLAQAGYRVEGVDLTPAMLEEARALAAQRGLDITFREMDAQALDYEDGCFDAVISRNLTWTLPDPERAYGQWFRVLKPGGVLLNFDADYAANVRSRSTQNRRVPADSPYGHVGMTDRLQRENDEITLTMDMGRARPAWDREVLEQKEDEFTAPVMREVERVVLLRVVDEYWMEHIDAMSDLRQGIRLRAYAQTDPIIAYKKESLEMFEEMIAAIQDETVRRLYSVRLKKNEEVKRERVANATSESVGGDGTVKKQPRKVKKIGRNEPCPCGSGKKYKNCCGRNA